MILPSNYGQLVSPKLSPIFLVNVEEIGIQLVSVFTVVGHAKQVNYIDVSPDNKKNERIIATCSQDKLIKVNRKYQFTLCRFGNSVLAL